MLYMVLSLEAQFGKAALDIEVEYYYWAIASEDVISL